MSKELEQFGTGSSSKKEKVEVVYRVTLKFIVQARTLLRVRRAAELWSVKTS